MHAMKLLQSKGIFIKKQHGSLVCIPYGKSPQISKSCQILLHGYKQVVWMLY